MGEAISQVGQTVSHFTGDPCKARIRMRDEVSIPHFTNEKNDFMGAQYSPQGFSAGEKGIRIKLKLTPPLSSFLLVPSPPVSSTVSWPL